MWNGLPIIIIGLGGMARETKIIIDDINKLGYEKKYNILGYVSEKKEDIGKVLGSHKVIASDDTLINYINKYKLIGVVIAISDGKIKKNIYNRLKVFQDKIVYPNIISPKANIGDYNSVLIGQGNIICPGVIITTDLEVGNFNLINMNVTLGHDSKIRDFCTINPLTAIGGDVKIGSNVLLGAGVTVKQGVKIKENSIIGMGAIIVKNVGENEILICKAAEKLGGKK